MTVSSFFILELEIAISKVVVPQNRQSWEFQQKDSYSYFSTC